MISRERTGCNRNPKDLLPQQSQKINAEYAEAQSAAEKMASEIRDPQSAIRNPKSP